MNNKGFIALTLVLFVSTILLAFSFVNLIEYSHFFDETERKEYRLISSYQVDSCINIALLTLAKDYFFTLKHPIDINEFNCTIDTVSNDNGMVTIIARGNQGNIKINKTAKAIVHDYSIEIISIE